MRLETLKRMEDARAACVRIGNFTSGVSKEEFVGSELLRSAVERQLETTSTFNLSPFRLRPH